MEFKSSTPPLSPPPPRSSSSHFSFLSRIHLISSIQQLHSAFIKRRLRACDLNHFSLALRPDDMQPPNVQEPSSSNTAAQRLSRILASLSDGGGSNINANTKVPSATALVQPPPAPLTPALPSDKASSVEGGAEHQHAKQQPGRRAGNSDAGEGAGAIKYRTAATAAVLL
jgi:hypothetical protein